jgi:hypothetical protein
MAVWMNEFMAEETARRTSAYGGTRAVPLREQREVCGNPACSGGWLAFLRDRRRPVFDRQWGCSAKCLETMARAGVQRESGEEDAEGRGAEHRHRMPLGLILLAQGWITQAQLEHALDRQRRAGKGRIGSWLTQECGLDPRHITRGLGVQWGCPVLSMEGFDAQRMALAAPRLLVEQTEMLPLRIAGARTLQLAFADRPDASAALAVERMSGLKVESGLMDPSPWAAGRQRLGQCRFVEAAFEPVGKVESLPGRIAAALSRMQPMASRLVRVHQFYWLRMWLESGAMRTRDGGLPWTSEDVADRLYAVGGEQ